MAQFIKGRTPWNKGKKCPAMSKRLVGNKYALGRKHSKEAKIKMSEAHRGTKKPWAGKYNKEHSFSKETRRKMSESLKGKRPKSYYKKIGLRGVLKQQTTKNHTSIEKRVYDELKARGLLFEKQKLINGRFLVDAYIPSLNLVVEADGNYWHSLDRVVKKDKAENAYLTKCGYNLLRLSEKEINDGSFKERMVN